MTTIATDGKSMAGDGLVTSNGTIFGRSLQKVRRLGDGQIVGFAGSGYDGQAFVDWLANGGDKPTLSEKFEALVLHSDGSCLTYDQHCYPLTEELPTASGSGRELALAALDLGETPEEAVAYASTRDTCTGGKITVLHLHELKAVA